MQGGDARPQPPRPPVPSARPQYRPGQRLRARVLGFRPMDGLAVLTCKPSAVDQQILSLADLRPGMPVSALVVRVEEFGVLLAITPSIRWA